MSVETSISVQTTATGRDDMKYAVSVSNGVEVITLTIEGINKLYYDRIQERLSPMLNKVISNLIKSREFLGLQLNLEFGNINQNEYEQLETEFLTEPIDIPIYELSEDVHALMQLTNRVFNAEEISTMFNCPIESAEKAIDKILIGEGSEE